MLDRARFRPIVLCCLLTGSVACGSSTRDPDGTGTVGSDDEASNTAGGSTRDGSTAGGSAAGSITGGSSTASGGVQSDPCDCESRDCRPAPEVAVDLCSGGDLVTYTEREGCDYVELSLDYNRGWEAYYYDEQGTLVAFGLDNAFGGSLHCGLPTSCTGDIIQQCRLCRASWLEDDEVPDCPTTLWETADGTTR